MSDEEKEEQEPKRNEKEKSEQILYALIARGQTSLVDYSTREGNHVLLAQQILAKAKQDTDHKRSFPDRSGQYQFHYMLRDGLTYLCFATAEKKTAVCFSFLDEIRLKFLGTYDMDLIAKAMAYSTSFLDFKRILKDEMAKWGAVEFSDAKIENVSRKIDKVKDTMKGNIDKLWERDSQIEDLLEKTELLETETKTFKTNTNKLAAHFWWKNFKIWAIIIVVLIVLTWLIASLICGFKFECLKSGGGKCFHIDSHVTVQGRQFMSLEEVRTHSGCHVPHVFEAKGVIVSTTCSDRPLRLTANHLVMTPRYGFREAGALVAGDELFSDLARSSLCAVKSVSTEQTAQQYYGLNCPGTNSLVLADNVLVSTFEVLHTIPALWIKYASKIFGVQYASKLGDMVASLFYGLMVQKQ